MSNWYRKIAQLEAERYRAVIPVDLWVNATGDPKQDQELAYNTLKQILSAGSQAIPNDGFNELLSLNDINKYSDVIPF